MNARTLLTLNAIANRLARSGVSRNSLYYRRHELPEPDGRTAKGSPLYAAERLEEIQRALTAAVLAEEILPPSNPVILA